MDMIADVFAALAAESRFCPRLGQGSHSSRKCWPVLVEMSHKQAKTDSVFFQVFSFLCMRVPLRRTRTHKKEKNSKKTRETFSKTVQEARNLETSWTKIGAHSLEPPERDFRQALGGHREV